MTRVKRGTTTLKRRKKILGMAKGFRNARSTKEKQAKEGILHAGVHAFNDRRKKKNDFRRLWQTKIGASAKTLGLSYSKFMDALKKKDIKLDRKSLADIAENHPETFNRIVEQVK